MKTASLLPLLLLLSSPAFAQALPDCTALASSSQSEPPGWAGQCAAAAPATSLPGPWRAAPRALGDLAFAYNMIDWGADQGLYAFLLDDFQSMTLIGNPGPNIYALDFDPAGNVLYAIPDAQPRQVGTIDLETGAFQAHAPLTGIDNGMNVTGLTIDPVSGAAYLSVAGAGVESELHSLDLHTGVATLIGGNGVTLMIDLAMNCKGQMYGHSVFDDTLYRIDPETGAATPIGPYGLDANFAQGMDFDNSSGKLYAAIYTGGGNYVFGTFDLDTGALLPLVSGTPEGEWELAIATNCDDIFANGFQ